MNYKHLIRGGHELPISVSTDGTAMSLRSVYYKAGGANFVLKRNDGFNETGIMIIYEI